MEGGTRPHPVGRAPARFIFPVEPCPRPPWGHLQGRFWSLRPRWGGLQSPVWVPSGPRGRDGAASGDRGGAGSRLCQPSSQPRRRMDAPGAVGRWSPFLGMN